MEVEAWFLQKVRDENRPNMTIENIKSNLHFDLSTDDMSNRNEPASDLNYFRLVGKEYKKGSFYKENS